MHRTEIHRLFEAAADASPQSTAVRFGEQALTYGALNEAAEAMAATLRQRGGTLAPQMVALRLAPGPAYVTAMLAVLKAGHVFVPLDPALPERRMRALLEKTRPIAIVDDDVQWLPAAQPARALDADACYVVFTSGTTGAPKAIVGSHRGLRHFIEWEVREFGFDASVRVAQLAPPTFDVSLRDIFVPLAVGGIVVIPPPAVRLRADLLLAWLDEEKITALHCVPSLFRALLGQLERHAAAAEGLRALRHILLAGEPLYGGDIARWRAVMGDQAELVNLYGPSETTLAKAFHRIGELPASLSRMLPVGRPLPQTGILVLRDGERCDPGEIGELYIQTDFPSHGYLDDAERNAESFVVNPLAPETGAKIYRTGDMGNYNTAGEVVLIGRRDGQVKVQGVRIELGEIEQALMRHPAVEQAVVTAHRGDAHEMTLAAYFVARDAVTTDALREHLASWLPQSHWPAFYIPMEELAVDLHGKAIRRNLPPPADLLYRAQPCEAPSGAVEEALAAAWDEVLHIHRVSATHTFAELGGDSLKAIQVLARIVDRLGVEIKFQDLFPRGTIRRIAQSIAPPQAQRSDAAVGDGR